MEIRINSKILDKQIALCEKYEFYGNDKHEQGLFGGIAELLTEVDAALAANKTVKFREVQEEDEMEPKMRIVWTCNGNKYDERIVPADEVAMTVGNLFLDEWNHFGQDGDSLEIYEVE